jgi:hypothetical protein
MLGQTLDVVAAATDANSSSMPIDVLDESRGDDGPAGVEAAYPQHQEVRLRPVGREERRLDDTDHAVVGHDGESAGEGEKELPLQICIHIVDASRRGLEAR